MTQMDRREFVRLAGTVCLAGGAGRPALSAPMSPTPGPKAACPGVTLGVVVWVHPGEQVDTAIRQVRDLGLSTCQIGFKHLHPDVATPLKNALEKYGVTATAFSEHGPGERIFNFYQGPQTIGIVPPATRPARIANLKLASDIASRCGIPAVHTHCGFIPEDPNAPLYPQAVAAVKEVALHCARNGQMFLCETGQETPVTLLRLIQDVGLDNVFVNLDGANLIGSGKGNPVDAMDMIGRYVRGVHAKDGEFPTNPREFGRGAVMGQGKVDFPRWAQKLKEAGYRGPVHIEYEGDGDGQARKQAILNSKAYLENVFARAYALC